MSDSTTEGRLSAGQWLDRLDNIAALDVMLDGHGAAAAAVRQSLTKIDCAVTAITQRLKVSQDGRLIYAGAGSSVRIGVQDGVELPPTFDWPRRRIDYLIAGGPVALTDAVENAEDDENAASKAAFAASLSSHDVVIGISASGRTPFTCAAAKVAADCGALTVGIANNEAAPLFGHVDIAIPLVTGAEAVAGSTRLKAATAQKICLNMISTLVMTRLGFVRDGQMIAMKP
ncbi:MAG: N-acetylmuramic acid 6-phosphate etherase, partial [Pseudomonadota bacterium]|nr:N-acetylmuramic acid 6-phosphate etherase [Pseudomonadota bacterium]